MPELVDVRRTATVALPPVAATWREAFAASHPWCVAGVVALVALGTFGWCAVLLVAFDARSWWGESLAGVAASFGVLIGVVGVLLARVTVDRRRLAWFLSVAWVALSLVCWLPRQAPESWPPLARLAWWAALLIALYVLVPVAWARATGDRVRSYGLRIAVFRGEVAILVLLVPVILIGALLAAGQVDFADRYPYYRGVVDGTGSVAGLLAWWAMYAAMFVALEFFFRGFLTTVGYRLCGWWAVPAMGAMYCLLHLDKPIPELVTSLFGGMLLGVVALRTRSILAGIVAHVTLAIGTDAAVLLRA